MDKPKPASQLRKMYERVKSLDPLSGPNVMRHSRQCLKDNGDGTLTFVAPKPYRQQPKQ